MPAPPQSATKAPTSPGRIFGAIACIALIILSSTKLAGIAANYVYDHYLSNFGPFNWIQKTVHVALFFALGAVLFHSLRRLSHGRRFLFAIIGCLLVGTVSEVIQLFTGRDPAMADVVLNLVSGTSGALAALALKRLRNG